MRAVVQYKSDSNFSHWQTRRPRLSLTGAHARCCRYHSHCELELVHVPHCLHVLISCFISSHLRYPTTIVTVTICYPIDSPCGYNKSISFNCELFGSCRSGGDAGRRTPLIRERETIHQEQQCRRNAMRCARTVHPHATSFG